MKLVIAEKPSVGKTIAAVVGAKTSKDGYMEGNGYYVSWCFGHLVELEDPDYYCDSDSNEKAVWNIDKLPIIPQNWKLRLNDDSGVRKQYKVLKELMNSPQVDTIICATDAGREGECIFRYVYNFAGCTKYTERLWTSSLEESAIREGLKNMKPDSEYDNLYLAGLARAKADWLIGMNMTRMYSVKYKAYKPVLSIGRVQTPTLAMIVERYQKVENFVKEYFYKIELETNRGFSLKSEEKYCSKEEAEKIEEHIGTFGVVRSFEKTKQKKSPPTLFDLTLLQREANSQLGYTAQETLDILQHLYEMKYVTYPRTDSNYITDDMEDTAYDLIQKVALLSEFESMDAEEYFSSINVKCLINNKKVSDHHALLPTKQVNNEVFHKLSEKERNILKMICGRLLVAVAPAREYFRSKVTVEIDGKLYTATGNSNICNGYREIEKIVRLKQSENKKKEEIVDIPETQEGERVEIVTKNVIELETKPLQLYNDASLLKAMEIAGNEEYEQGTEKKGIGTPATRAGILETLVQRGYIVREKKKIIPTERGIRLISVVPSVLKSAKTTATWETALQQIESGEISSDYFMERITSMTEKLTAKAKMEEADLSLFAPQKEKFAECPKCGKDVINYSKLWKCCECDFKIFKEIAGKIITDTQGKKLIINGQTDKIKGFRRKSGEEFDARIVLDDEFNISFKKK
jgi:DNA topoisomerase-3